MRLPMTAQMEFSIRLKPIDLRFRDVE